jgi:short-subunit dehydrogenase
MMKQGTPCHILNVASVAGLLTSPHMPAYFATKHASVALTESVYYDVQASGAQIKMSVFCPGYVQTDLHNSERHRPERYSDPSDPYYSSEKFAINKARAKHVIETGMPIDSIGMSVFQAIEDEIFYILTDPRYSTVIGGRVKNILEGKVPDIKTFG